MFKPLFMIVPALLWASLVSATEFRIENGKKYNEVRFHSEATLESFDGINHSLSGALDVNTAGLDQASAAEFHIVMADFDTGITLRNSHMKKNHLQTDKFPDCSFVLTGLKKGLGVQLDNGVTSRELPLIASGDFTLHGVTRKIHVPISVQWFANAASTDCAFAGEAVHLACKFRVVLEDYGIPRPEFLFLKLAESIEIKVDCWATQQ